MISGNVQRMHPLVPVIFRRGGQPDLAIEFVVDTGFVGDLTLPAAAVGALGLVFTHDSGANLADDSFISVQVYSATILWHGVEREVDVLATGKRPLLGMALMHGDELVIQCREGGLVTIDDEYSV